jgi:hypothetical protein
VQPRMMAGKKRPAGTATPYVVIVSKNQTAANEKVSLRFSWTELLSKTRILPPCEFINRVIIGL